MTQPWDDGPDKPECMCDDEPCEGLCLERADAEEEQRRDDAMTRKGEEAREEARFEMERAW